MILYKALIVHLITFIGKTQVHSITLQERHICQFYDSFMPINMNNLPYNHIYSHIHQLSLLQILIHLINIFLYLA